MNIKHYENKMGLELVLTPETMKEVTELTRFAKNAKKEPASIYLSFSGDAPSLSVWFKKVNDTKQYNSIRPYENK